MRVVTYTTRKENARSVSNFNYLRTVMCFTSRMAESDIWKQITFRKIQTCVVRTCKLHTSSRKVIDECMKDEKATGRFFVQENPSDLDNVLLC